MQHIKTVQEHRRDLASLHIENLELWEYEVSGGFKLRGYYTPPTGKPVLHFIHGNGFCGLVYEKLLAPLQEHFDLFLSDAQGHGNSDDGPEFTHWRQSADYFSEAWQFFSPMWQNVTHIACGHSFGAVNTILMMAKHRDLFDRAILLDPIIMPPLDAFVATTLGSLGLSRYLPMVKQAADRTTFWPDKDSLWDYFHERGVFRGWDEQCLKSYLTHAIREDEEGYFLKCPPRIEAAIFGSYAKNLWDSIKRINKPVSVLYGDSTYGFLLRSIDKLEQVNSNFECAAVSGGHCFMMEDSHASSDLLLNKLLNRDKES